MAKTEIYSWRLSPHMKRALEEAARRQQLSVSTLLERIVANSLRNGVDGWDEGEAALQQRLHNAARKTIGAIKSGRRDRSTRVRTLVRRKLQRQLARGGSHLESGHERARAR
ncbi:MAG: hypothetical protein DME33_09000 [Verrucomicrobia bacterium]|nr:MAG: hypothetical protein DME33_09000 [Verrucomicrobiota bacterium]